MDRNALDRDAVRLSYLEAGSGDQTLLFIHGWCCDGTFWREQTNAFATRHRIIAVDLRGHGESAKPDQDYMIGGFAEDVAWLCRELDLERPVIVGHSMGGVIALNMARRWPDLMRAVVFVDAGITPFPKQFMPMVDSMIEGLKSPGYRDVAANFVKRFLFRAESPPQLRDEVAQRMAGAPQRVMHTALASSFSEENLMLGPLPVPSLFIRAATLPATEDELKECYPGMEVVSVDSAHFIHLEKPEEMNAILRRFIEALP